MKVKHHQWGIGTVLYELSGGYEILVNFDEHGKIKVIQKDCEKIPEAEEVEKVERKQGGGMCKNICKEFKATRPVDGKRYESGQLRCQTCEIYITIEGTQDERGLYCKCCNYRVRGKPRNRIYKAKLRNEEVEEVPEVEVEEVPEVEVEEEVSKNKKIVEAFRLGVAPQFAVQDITVGREKEIKSVEKWLEKESESLMIIGQYGQGKSHIIRYIREKALSEGYLVAYCDIGEESQMHKPKSVFNTLMKSLVFRSGEWNENNSGLKLFLILYAIFETETTENFSKDLSKFLRPGVDDLVRKLRLQYKTNELDGSYFASFIDYLCGDDYVGNTYRFNKKIAIQPYQTSASIICNILSSIGHMAASMNGFKNSFKGLILIFDEGETIDSPAYLSKQREGGINLIKGLTEISNNNENLLSETHDKKVNDGKRYGRKTNLMYSGMLMHRDTRFSNHKKNHVKCLFAFVEGESEVIDILEEHQVEKIVLNDFTSDEKNKLMDKILEIYKKAYDYEIEDTEKLKKILIKKLENSDNTRSIIKITMEAIELIKEHGSTVPHIDPSDYEKILR